jgi:hypothetical protein
VSEFVRKTNWPVLRLYASQTQLGFQSALIVQRLRGQGYGDSPWRGVHFFSTANSNNRLSDTIECSQPLPKKFNPKFSTLSIHKHYPTPEWCAGCSQPLVGVMTTSQHVYEVRPRRDHRGVDLISDALPFGRLWYGEPNAVSNAVDYAKFYSRSRCRSVGCGTGSQTRSAMQWITPNSTAAHIMP